MKTLYDLKQGERGLVKRINSSDRDLKERLISFGLTKGSEVEVKNCNAKRKNIEVSVDKSFIALREQEAKVIEIEVL